MSRLVALALSVAVLSPQTAHADGAWNGVYAGLQGGGIYGNWHFDFSGAFSLPINGEFAGVAGGWLAGAGGMAGPLYLGIEADVSEAAASGPTSVLGVAVLSIEPDWFVTLRGRAGFEPWQDTLVYGTAGIGWTDTSYRLSAGGATATDHETRAGLALGGGVEWAISGNVAGRIEYLHIDFPSKSFTDRRLTLTTFGDTSVVRAAIVFGF